MKITSEGFLVVGYKNGRLSPKNKVVLSKTYLKWGNAMRRASRMQEKTFKQGLVVLIETVQL